jgi:signal transduction histidine kinase
VIETAPLAIALFEPRGLRVQQLNQTATTFFGRALQDVLGTTPEQCCLPAQAAALRKWLQQAAAAPAGGPVRQHEWREELGERPRVWDCRITRLDEGGAQSSQLLLVASDVTEQRAEERARLQAAIAQREVLVREVHHRIKNNLQGVAGLLQQNATRHPEVAMVLHEAVGQVQAIAQVYGLQVGASGPLELASLLRAIAASAGTQLRPQHHVHVQGEVPHVLPEAESIPVALTVNELLTNAIKHGQGGEVRCQLQAEGEGVLVQICGPGCVAGGL